LPAQYIAAKVVEKGTRATVEFQSFDGAYYRCVPYGDLMSEQDAQAMQWIEANAILCNATIQWNNKAAQSAEMAA